MGHSRWPGASTGKGPRTSWAHANLARPSPFPTRRITAQFWGDQPGLCRSSTPLLPAHRSRRPTPLPCAPTACSASPALSIHPLVSFPSCPQERARSDCELKALCGLPVSGKLPWRVKQPWGISALHPPLKPLPGTRVFPCAGFVCFLA